MAISLKELRDKMVPPSTRRGSSTDDQWLEPASFDKKLVKAMKGEKEEIYDEHDEKNRADNFTAQNLVKKNTKAPLREESPSSDVGGVLGKRVNDAYEEEALDLVEEILDLVDDVDGESGYYWKEVSQHLKCARDCLLNSMVSESVELIDESFKVGSFKLKDGSKVKLTKEDAQVLNVAVAGTSNQTKLMNEVTKDKSEFNHFLTFARNLKEDYDAALENILDEATDAQLEHIVENQLSEGDVWNHVKGGASVGASVGKGVGSIVGATGGAIYGGALGGAIGTAKNAGKISKIIKNWNKKKTIEEEDDNRKESVLGSAEPAMDSDKKKKEDLQEINSFNYKPARRGTVKWMIQQQAKSGEYEDGVTKPLDDKFKKPLDDKFKKPLDDKFKKKKKEDLQEVNQRAFSRITGIKPIGRTIQSHQFADSIGGDSSNYRNPAEKPIKFSKTEPGKKLSEYIITPHDVVGKMPKKEGDVFTVKYDRNSTVQLELIKIVDNRLYGKPIKKA